MLSLITCRFVVFTAVFVLTHLHCSLILYSSISFLRMWRIGPEIVLHQDILSAVTNPALTRKRKPIAFYSLSTVHLHVSLGHPDFVLIFVIFRTFKDKSKI